MASIQAVSLNRSFTISGNYLENSANLKKRAHISPTQGLPHACLHPHHVGSGSHGQLFALSGAHQHCMNVA